VVEVLEESVQELEVVEVLEESVQELEVDELEVISLQAEEEEGAVVHIEEDSVALVFAVVTAGVVQVVSADVVV